MFVALFLLWNWAEYSAINGLGNPIYVITHFPLYIQYDGAGNAVQIFIDSNFTLVLFLLATFINLYLAFRLQTSKETGNKELSH